MNVYEKAKSIVEIIESIDQTKNQTILKCNEQNKERIQRFLEFHITHTYINWQEQKIQYELKNKIPLESIYQRFQIKPNNLKRTQSTILSRYKKLKNLIDAVYQNTQDQNYTFPNIQVKDIPINSATTKKALTILGIEQTSQITQRSFKEEEINFPTQRTRINIKELILAYGGTIQEQPKPILIKISELPLEIPLRSIFYNQGIKYINEAQSNAFSTKQIIQNSKNTFQIYNTIALIKLFQGKIISDAQIPKPPHSIYDVAKPPIKCPCALQPITHKKQDIYDQYELSEIEKIAEDKNKYNKAELLANFYISQIPYNLQTKIPFQNTTQKIRKTFQLLQIITINNLLNKGVNKKQLLYSPRYPFIHILVTNQIEREILHPLNQNYKSLTIITRYLKAKQLKEKI